MNKTIELNEPSYYVTDSVSGAAICRNCIPKYTAIIEIGSWHIYLIDKTFTQEQIDHMREYFGWEVRNLCE